MADRRWDTVEVESLAQFDELIGEGASSMSHWRLQDVDLTDRGPVLAKLEVRGALLLGCALLPDVEDDLRARGALVFPRMPDAPVNPYRAVLYSPAELYDGLGDSYDHTVDARAYGWSRHSRDLTVTLTQALHDHAIDDALTEFVGGRLLVGVMGGHTVERGSETYRAAATLGRDLTRAGMTVVTGGGPGAMEAANLGAYLSPYDEQDLADAIGSLAAVPTYSPSIEEWARTAFAVLDRWPEGADSVGIPTWFYGHEPPNVLATTIAKYFKNAIREDILLHLANAGIVFLPGRAGTVQEIFQDACENYYAEEQLRAPMILVGRHHWVEELPAWPLLSALADGSDMADTVHVVDDLSEVLPLLGG